MSPIYRSSNINISTNRFLHGCDELPPSHRENLIGVCDELVAAVLSVSRWTGLVDPVMMTHGRNKISKGVYRFCFDIGS